LSLEQSQQPQAAPSAPLKLRWRWEKSTWLAFGLILFGAAVRVAQYASNRSLWLDEAALALNIVNRSPGQLLLPLDYHQGAPIGFLLMQWLSVKVLGNSEYALRLLPLVAGIATLFLFYVIARRTVGKTAALIGLALAAVSHYLIYYSAEAKQYSTDAAFALVVIGLGLYLGRQPVRARQALFAGFCGAGVIWFSHPAALMLAGVGVCIGLVCIGRREWRGLMWLALAVAIWLLSFSAAYLVSLGALSADRTLLAYWQFGFAPIVPLNLNWYLTSFLKMFDDPGGMPQTGLAALAFIVGLIALGRQSRFKLGLLGLPIVIAVFVSALQKYPFAQRMILFLVPIWLMLIAAGVADILRQTRKRTAMIGLALVSLLLIPPAADAAGILRAPLVRVEIRPAVDYIRTHDQAGDLLYVYYAARVPFQYYAARLNLAPDAVSIGQARSDWSGYFGEVDQQRGNSRVWFLFSDVARNNGANEKQLFLYQLDQIGRQLDAFESPGASAYLYDLTK
jgi:uncharacterized membrane protein